MYSHWLPQYGAFLRYSDLPGAAPACVYLSGLSMTAASVFDELVRAPGLVGRRSVLVDWLGCGHSDRPAQFGYALDDHAMTVAALLDRLGLRRSSLIGFSMGGSVAITLAALRPDLVGRLVLIEALLDPGGGSFSAPIAEQPEAEFVRSGFATLIDQIRAEAVAGDDGAARLVGVLQSAAPHALHRSATGLVRGTRPTMRERLIQLAIPRAYVFGEYSLPHPNHDELPRHGIPVSVVPAAGHMMMWDNPPATAELLAALLAEAG